MIFKNSTPQEQKNEIKVYNNLEPLVKYFSENNKPNAERNVERIAERSAERSQERSAERSQERSGRITEEKKYFDLREDIKGYEFESKPIEEKPQSKLVITKGVSNELRPMDNFNNNLGTYDTTNSTAYTSDLFRRTVMTKKMADFNINLNNIMTMIPDMYKNTNTKLVTPKYKPIELNDIEAAVFNKDTIDLRDDRVTDLIYNSIADDIDDQRQTGGYN